MAGAIPVVKGYALRATKIDACGKPIQGPKNRIVTKGFIEFSAEPELKNREELEQLNAEGKVCFSDTTPPEIKRHNLRVQLCGVDPDLETLFNSLNEKILDYDDNVIGMAAGREVDTAYGVALEIWTGGRSDDDCLDDPTDSIFSIQGSGTSRGYLLVGGKEWVTGNFTVNAQVSNFDLNGISIPIPHWGRGPYNVARIDDTGTAGRLLVPVSKKREFTFFRTLVDPPEETNGACELGVKSIFTGGSAYYGASSVDVAPPQPICNPEIYTATITGAPTGGTWVFNLDGNPTTGIAQNAASTAVQTAIEALPNVEVGEVAVSGSAGGPYTIKLDPKFGVPTKTVSFTGGTSPNVTIAPA